MKYRATISVEFEAFDHPELRQKKQDLAEWMQAFEERFGPATLLVKERRARRAPRAAAPVEVWQAS